MTSSPLTRTHRKNRKENKKTANKRKFYDHITDLKTFDLVDAQDYRGNWYRGIIVGAKIKKNSSYSIKIHFIDFAAKWDEFYTDENIEKIAPPGHFANEPKAKNFVFVVYHRVNQSYFDGIPFVLSLCSEITWEEAYGEIVTQASRYVRRKSNYFKLVRSGEKPNLEREVKDMIENPPFEISFIEPSRKRGMFGTLKAKSLLPTENLTKRTYERCRGGGIKRNDDKIKWLLSCAKENSIYLEWTEDDFKDAYQEVKGTNHESANTLIDLETRRKNGVKLQEGLNLFVKEDTLDDFQGDVSFTLTNELSSNHRIATRNQKQK